MPKQHSHVPHVDQIVNPFFQEALRVHVEKYVAQFGDGLAAVYVWGSVYRNEAVPGVSDLDLDVFVNDPLTEADEVWYNRMRDILAQSYPGTNALVRPRVAGSVLQGLEPQASEWERLLTQAYAFRLSYDAALVWGCNLLPGLSPPVPDRFWVRESLESVRALVRYAARLEAVNRSDFDLPHDEALRLRKFARLGVLAGAHLLMAQGVFTSFRGDVVLPKLRYPYPEWYPFLEETAALYIHPVPTSEQRSSAYLALLVEWVDWVANQVTEISA